MSCLETFYNSCIHNIRRLLFTSFFHPRKACLSWYYWYMYYLICSKAFKYVVQDISTCSLPQIYFYHKTTAYLDGSAPIPRRYCTHLSPLFLVDLLIAKWRGVQPEALSKFTSILYFSIITLRQSSCPFWAAI